MRRLVFTVARGLLAIGLGAVVWGLPPTGAQESSRQKIVAIDPVELARKVFPGAMPVSEGTSYVAGWASRRFFDPESRQGGDLRFGLYPDDSGATAALLRTLPQQVDHSLRGGEIDGFVSRRSCHLQYRNLFVLLGLDELEPAGRELIAGCRALSAALSDPEIVRLGERVNTPRIRVTSLAAYKTAELRETAVFTFSLEGDTDVLIDRAGSQKVHKLAGETYQKRVERGFYDREPVLRVVRPTGEVAEVSLGKALQAGTAIAAPPDKAGATLPGEATEAIVEALRAGRLAPQDQTRLMLRLCESSDPELIPFFAEILASDRSSVLKQHALRGLADGLGEAGIDRYRGYAADRAQAEVVRRDAIRLVGRHGDLGDVLLLDEIAREGNESFDEWIEHAIANLRGKASAGE